MFRAVRSTLRFVPTFVLASLVISASTRAAEHLAADAAKIAAARAKAVEFLKTSQADYGGWTTNRSPGISGLVTAALLESGVSVDDAAAQKALKHLSTYIQPDGGIYSPNSDLKNYETCVALVAFHAANKDRRYDKVIENVRDFLKKLQWNGENGGIKPDDTKFGGAGYGSASRPDLSNTAWLVDALHSAGLSENDPVMKDALVFISRCQNLESEHNTLPEASKVNDGGFYYTPLAGGGPAGGRQAPEGGLRSYGSMTYAGLKSMVYAGLTPDDPRVAAALKWIRKYYSVSENPGMGQAGVFYYYHTFAKSLAAAKLDKIADDKGVEHDWRAELADHLLSAQKPNGSWVNTERQWMETDPNLSTAFALLSLAYCQPAGTK